MIEAQKLKIPYERKPGTIHSFFALKFHDGEEDRAKAEAIESALNQAGVEIENFLRQNTWNQVCGGANVNNSLFIRIAKGSTSTAYGMTAEYIEELLRCL